MELRTIPGEDFEKAAAIEAEYLDNDRQKFSEKYERYPDLFAGYYEDGKLVGICYGWPFEHARGKDEFILQGIAVVEPYNAKGRGGDLIRLFEEQVRKRGGKIISVGSAGGYVEKFYLKNGYVPVEYCVKVEKDKLPEDYKDKGFTISREREEGSFKILYIPAPSYDLELKERIKNAFGGEVIFIFERRL